MSDKDKFLLYTANNGAVKVEVLYKEETVWLAQKRMAELFRKNVRTINEHIRNIIALMQDRLTGRVCVIPLLEDGTP